MGQDGQKDQINLESHSGPVHVLLINKESSSSQLWFFLSPHRRTSRTPPPPSAFDSSPDSAQSQPRPAEPPRAACLGEEARLTSSTSGPQTLA